MPECNVYEYKQHQGLLSEAMFLAFIPTLIRLSRSQKNHKNINEWAMIQQEMQLCQKLVVWKNCKFKKNLLFILCYPVHKSFSYCVKLNKAETLSNSKSCKF